MSFQTLPAQMPGRKPEMKKCIPLFLLIFLLSACAGETLPANTVSAEKMTEHVGEIPGTEYYVAIAVASTGDVLAYVCNGMGSDYLFRGALENDSLKLTSDAGQAGLEATLDGAAYNGTFSVDGATHSFTTEPVQDYGGLYRVTGLSEFEAKGTSQGGAILKMNLTPKKELVQVTVTTPDGNTLSYERPWPADRHDHREPTEYSESWLIFLNDSRARGGHIHSSIKTGVRHIDPICPP
jgi:hypothetical protein